MDQGIKSRWVEALKSGKYQQTEEYLRRQHDDGTVGHCCLGVLCDISGLGHWEKDEHTGGYQYVIPQSDIELMDLEGMAVLHPAVRDWAGLKSTDPDIKENFQKLSSMNDDGESFEHIAEKIEMDDTL